MDTNVYNNTPTPAPLQVLTAVFNQYMVTPSQQFDISSNEDGWGNMWSTLRARADVPSTLMYLCGLNPGVTKLLVFGYCDNSMLEKNCRCRKRGTQAT